MILVVNRRFGTQTASAVVADVTTSAPVVTGVPTTLVASSAVVTGTTSAITPVGTTLSTPSAPFSSVTTNVLDSSTVTTIDSSSVSLSTSPLAIVPTTSSSFTSTSTGTSTGTSASASSTHSYHYDTPEDERKQTFFLGIALAVISFVLIVAGIITWFVRTRRLRREAREHPDWPWDHDPFDVRQDKMEGGLGIHTEDGQQVKRWDSNLMIEEANDIVPPPPVHAHERAYGSSPFVAVTPHGSHPSVPDLAQDMGTLHIRNLAPGDLSGGETSRASTAFGPAHTYQEDYGTPYERKQPVFMSLDGQGLDTPWAPLRTRKSKVAQGMKQRQYAREADMEEVSLEEPLPYPGEHSARASNTVDGQDGWATSIRSNLYNVYSAVVGGPAPESDGTDDDSFTRQPTRHSQRRRAGFGPRDNSSDIAHVDTGDPELHGASWTLEETGKDRGVVHFRDNLEYDDPRNRNHNPFDDDVNAPYAHDAYNDSRLLSAGHSGPVTRSSSLYSDEQPPSRVGLRPPRLPSIPNLSATTSQESGSSSRRKDSSRSHNRRRTKKYGRPAFPTRKSSQASAISASSDMSRTSSGYSDELTDGERYAKEILRERRRRMNEISVGRTKTSRSRATMLSRRRSNLSVKQQREV